MQEIKVAIRMDAEHLHSCEFPIELAFWDEQAFLKTDIFQLKQSIDYHKLSVSSIHAPAFRMLRGDAIWPWCKLFEIARMLKVNYIVAHPPFGKFREFADHWLPKLAMFIPYFGIFTICWETFSSKRRTVNSLEHYLKICNDGDGFGCCWDYSHVDGDEKEIEPYLPFTPIIHVSNTISNLRHQRLFVEGGRLNFRKVVHFLQNQNWSGECVLEYLPEYHDFLIEDAHKLEGLIWGEK